MHNHINSVLASGMLCVEAMGTLLPPSTTLVFFFLFGFIAVLGKEAAGKAWDGVNTHHLQS